MKDEKLRESLNKYGEENDITFTLLDNPFFDKSIIGMTANNKLVYDYDKMIEEFMEDNDCDYEEAMEFIDYNTLRALPYFGDDAPLVLVDKIENISEMY